MLAATKHALFKIGIARGQLEVRERLRRDGIVCCAEGAGADVAALDDRSLVIVQDTGPRTIKTGIKEPIESLLILAEEEDRAGPEVLIGTEGAHLFRLTDDGVERIKGFDELDCRDGWHTPWGGPPAVRTLAASADGWVYADIHVGSIMRSSDLGQSWEPVAPTLNEDVHQVATCPAAPDRVYANTARAVYISDDRGASWEHRARDLDARYGRAIAVAPDQPDLLLATVSDGPHGENVHGQLYRSEDAGHNWAHVAEGFPASTKDNINTCHVVFTPDGRAWALVGRTVHVGEEKAAAWRPCWEATEPLVMLASR